MPGYRIVLKPLEVDDERTTRSINQIRASLENPIYQNTPILIQTWKRQIESLQKRLQSKGERVIDADFAKIIDGGTLLVGIGPTSSKKQYLRGFMGKRTPNGTAPIQRKKRDHEFYSLKWEHAAKDGKGAYELHQKFEKIMSMNLDNVVSINGKPVIGKLDNLDRGIQHLGLDEGWSIDDVFDTLEE
jgi:hypothetical protein